MDTAERASSWERASPRLTADQMSMITRFGRREDLAGGQVLLAPGDRDVDFFLVLDGRVDLVAPGGAAPHLTTDRVVTKGPGDFIGDLGILTGQRWNLRATAVEDTSVCRISPAAFRRLMSSQTRIAEVIWAALSERRSRLERSAAGTLQIVSAPGDPEGLAVRELLLRAGVPHTWVDPSGPSARTRGSGRDLAETDLPAALLNGRVLRRVTSGALADELGLTLARRQHNGEDPNGQTYDLAVIGAGPAGLSAAVTAASEGLRVAVLDAKGPGGQAGCSAKIENYPGFPEGISGHDLATRTAMQALKFGAEFFYPCRVGHVAAGLWPTPHELVFPEGERLLARQVVVASGLTYRRPSVPSWAQFEGAGIYFAATVLEAGVCRGRPVAVIGGANSAGQAALFLADSGCKVTLIVRALNLSAKMSNYLVRRVASHPLIALRLGSEVTALHGSQTLAEIDIADAVRHRVDRIPCSGLFCFIGARPETDLVATLDIDLHGFIRTGETTDEADAHHASLPFETSVPGIFAVGDVRRGSIKRVAAAVGEGASAVASVHRRAATLAAAIS